MSENMSDIYHYAMEAWEFDQLEPDYGRISSYKKPIEKPTWKLKQESLEKYPLREELTDEEKNIKSDEYLKKYGL